MATVAERPATLEDLYRVEGRAELIDGRIVQLMASGDAPSDAALNIAISLKAHAKKKKRGVAKGDGAGYAVPILSSGRESFQPDASYYDGPRPKNRMKFMQGPPTFAVEVRSECDYGKAAEAEMASKRADYFEAGTLVVWDADPKHEQIHVYRHDRPSRAQTFRSGQSADAEPAVPGWRMAVADVFGE